MQTKVVKILSETEIVLGAGSENGIEEGTEFLIYEDGDEILDPETNKSLGILEIVKGYVTVINVQPKVSIAKTHTRTITKKRFVQVPSMVSVFAGLYGGGGIREEQFEVEKVEKLKVEKPDSDYENRLIVRVGDKARPTRE
ncbi:MAG: hypothetical protein ACLP2Y_00105 [Limisphaerales bacterium]